MRLAHLLPVAALTLLSAAAPAPAPPASAAAAAPAQPERKTILTYAQKMCRQQYHCSLRGTACTPCRGK